MAQGVCPEFNPQYLKKKKKVYEIANIMLYANTMPFFHRGLEHPWRVLLSIPL
jgi:hypothetical protein